jgi:hypothetical protein
MVDVQLVVGVVSMVGLALVAAAMCYLAFAGPSRDLTTTAADDDASAAD